MANFLLLSPLLLAQLMKTVKLFFQAQNLSANQFTLKLQAETAQFETLKETQSECFIQIDLQLISFARRHNSRSFQGELNHLFPDFFKNWHFSMRSISELLEILICLFRDMQWIFQLDASATKLSWSVLNFQPLKKMKTKSKFLTEWIFGKSFQGTIVSKMLTKRGNLSNYWLRTILSLPIILSIWVTTDCSKLHLRPICHSRCKFMEHKLQLTYVMRFCLNLHCCSTLTLLPPWFIRNTAVWFLIVASQPVNWKFFLTWAIWTVSHAMILKKKHFSDSKHARSHKYLRCQKIVSYTRLITSTPVWSKCRWPFGQFFRI